VRTLRQLLRDGFSRAARASGAACLALLVLPALAATDPELQIITAVVQISVPAAAFNPGTGQAEVTVPRGLVVQVASSNSWKLRLRATRANFVTQTIPVHTKPVSVLQLRKVDGGAPLVLSATYFEIARGGNTHGWDEQAYDVIFQATSGDAAGLYSVNLEFDFH
jgi:hypothetical protein